MHVRPTLPAGECVHSRSLVSAVPSSVAATLSLGLSSVAHADNPTHFTLRCTWNDTQSHTSGVDVLSFDLSEHGGRYFSFTTAEWKKLTDVSTTNLKRYIEKKHGAVTLVQSLNIDRRSGAYINEVLVFNDAANTYGATTEAKGSCEKIPWQAPKSPETKF